MPASAPSSATSSRSDVGRIEFNALPGDRVAGRDRWLGDVVHDGTWRRDIHYGVNGIRVSDDDYWKDFSRQIRSFTPRLLPLNARVDQQIDAHGLRRHLVRRHAALAGAAQQRAGLRDHRRRTTAACRWACGLDSELPLGMRFDVETEINRFTRAEGLPNSIQPNGWRGHVLASVSRPFETPAFFVRPKMTLNSATYALDQPMLDGRMNANRTVPTFSVDTGAVFERDSQLVRRRPSARRSSRACSTSTRRSASSSTLPNFDSAPNDFNFDLGLHRERVLRHRPRVRRAPAHRRRHHAAGSTPNTGAEALRLGIAQRYLFRDQRVTPDGAPLTQRLSDVLLARLDLAGAELDASTRRCSTAPRPAAPVRSIARRALLAGAVRTVERHLSPGARAVASSSSSAGSGRSIGRPRRPAASSQRQVPAAARCTPSAGSTTARATAASPTRSPGVEYDAGCWIGRFVAERLSTGRTEATTRLLLQLELVGLSRLGSNPLQVLKDNIPGYRLLREERTRPPIDTHDR